MQILLEDVDLLEILWGDNSDFEPVTDEILLEQTRWSIYYERVFKRLNDGTFWRFNWSRGATEYQDEGYENVSAIQVEPKEVTTIQYVPVGG